MYDLSDPNESEPTRRQTLAVSRRTMPEDMLAIVRLSWFRDGKPYEVDEFQIVDTTDNGYDALGAVVTEAITCGADVSVISGMTPEELGLE